MQQLAQGRLPLVSLGAELIRARINKNTQLSASPQPPCPSRSVSTEQASVEQINTSQASDIGLIRMGSAAKESPTHSTSTSSTAWRSLGLHLLWISQGDVLQNLCQATSNNERSHRNLSHSCRYHRRSWPGARVIAFWRRVLDEARVLTGSSGLLRASTGSYGLPRASAGLLRASAGFCSSGLLRLLLASTGSYGRASTGSHGLLRASAGSSGLLRAPTNGLLRAPTGFFGASAGFYGLLGLLRAPTGFCGLLRAPT